MQLERKRKAAQFLAQLAEKRTTVSSVEPVELVSKLLYIVDNLDIFLVDTNNFLLSFLYLLLFIL